MRLRLASLLAVAVLPYPHMLQTMHTLAHSSTPFAAGEQGQSVYIGIEVPVERTYRFCLDFHIDPDNAAQRSAMNQLPGDSAAGRIRLPVRLRIVQMREHDFVPLLDQAFAEERQVSVPNGYVSMVIASLELPAGDYRIRAEALQNNEATRALPIAFGVHPG